MFQQLGVLSNMDTELVTYLETSLAKCDTTSRSCWHLVRSSDQVDIWSDRPPDRDILWPSMILLWIRLAMVRCTPRQWHLVAKCDTTFGQVEIWSDHQVRSIFGPIFRSGWHLVRSSGQVDIWSDITPRQRHFVARCDTTSSQVDIWSDVFPRQRHLVAKSDIYFRPGWHLVRSSGQVDIWSDITSRQRHFVARCDTTSSQVDIWSDVFPRQRHLVAKCDTTLGQIFGSGWHLVRCIPGRDILWPSVILLWVRLTFGQIFRSGWHFVKVQIMFLGTGRMLCTSDPMFLL